MRLLGKEFVAVMSDDDKVGLGSNPSDCLSIGHWMGDGQQQNVLERCVAGHRTYN